MVFQCFLLKIVKKHRFSMFSVQNRENAQFFRCFLLKIPQTVLALEGFLLLFKGIVLDSQKFCPSPPRGLDWPRLA